ncbi:DUF4303 domain-containing protein [Acinetobacter sp. 194]|uniref:DUF4303 domain-containing protein n=1 Tax=Acinetobacter shaoyimingii TaxID=2715164 RepID=UPI00140BC573|nr:DUF4303 domain-containing protein [Acinetobacter shaoyimingii]NHB58742.1 DUF4303 domain-containing protein [Acinetobacter shaoyimingii]
MFDLKKDHAEYLSTLEKIIVNEFEALYSKYAEQSIYAFALVLDERMLPLYTTVSTNKSLLNQEENRFQYLADTQQWHIDKWKYQSIHLQELNLFSRKISDYIQQSRLIITNLKFKNEFYDDLTSFYLQAMHDARQNIMYKYMLDEDDILFIVHQTGNEEFTVQSIKHLNNTSATVFEAIADLRSIVLFKEKNNLNHKLSQQDKDVLIDLRQLLKITSSVELGISYQAQLLIRDPYFLDLNQDIQRLIQDIATMDDHHPPLTKSEILERIQRFYMHEAV